MANRHHSYNSGRIHRATGEEQPAQQSAPVATRKKQKRRGRRWPKVLVIVLVIFGLLAAGAFAFLGYLDGVFEPGALGSRISKDYVPKAYSKQDVVHFLIIGIDNEEDRSYAEGLGQTDMILYAKFDIKNSKLSMLQIPRDSFVGDDESTGGTGKINALLLNGPDAASPINNLADVIEKQFKLPVDHYVSMDMDALQIIVDNLGGLKVFVPRDMNYAGSSLSQGWQWMNGDAVKFFVRNRKGEGFERADIDRLDNQRHFYSALFRRFLNLTPGDIAKLLPVFEYYCNTDIPLKDIFDLCVSGLKLTAEDVIFGKVPGVTGMDPAGAGRDLYVIDIYGRDDGENIGVAALMNQYFREEGQAVPGEELGLPQVSIPESATIYPPNIQVMGEVQEGEGGADVNVEPT